MMDLDFSELFKLARIAQALTIWPSQDLKYMEKWSEESGPESYIIESIKTNNNLIIIRIY